MIMQTGGLKVFLIGYDTFGIARDTLTAFLDTRSEIRNWYYVLPGQLFVVSPALASELAPILRERFPNQFLVVTQIFADMSDGWMPKQVWDFIREPKQSQQGLLAAMGQMLSSPPEDTTIADFFKSLGIPPKK